MRKSFNAGQTVLHLKNINKISFVYELSLF